MLVHELKALPDRSKLIRVCSAMGEKAHLHNGCKTFENVSLFQYPDRRRERPQARHNHEKTILAFYQLSRDYRIAGKFSQRVESFQVQCLLGFLLYRFHYIVFLWVVLVHSKTYTTPPVLKASSAHRTCALQTTHEETGWMSHYSSFRQRLSLVLIPRIVRRKRMSWNARGHACKIRMRGEEPLNSGAFECSMPISCTRGQRDNLFSDDSSNRTDPSLADTSTSCHSPPGFRVQHLLLSWFRAT